MGLLWLVFLIWFSLWLILVAYGLCVAPFGVELIVVLLVIACCFLLVSCCGICVYGMRWFGV